ncbi:MAG: cytochrome c oxidase subunit 2A [Thermaceae bacterium]|nr:cytochrome c oxidase subunit 2A [Thermaceae bacterium]
MKQEEKRPIGALLVVGVLTLFILTFWLFTYFLHLTRG